MIDTMLNLDKDLEEILFELYTLHSSSKTRTFYNYLKSEVYIKNPNPMHLYQFISNNLFSNLTLDMVRIRNIFAPFLGTQQYHILEGFLTRCQISAFHANYLAPRYKPQFFLPNECKEWLANFDSSLLIELHNTVREKFLTQDFITNIYSDIEEEWLEWSPLLFAKDLEKIIFTQDNQSRLYSILLKYEGTLLLDITDKNTFK